MPSPKDADAERAFWCACMRRVQVCICVFAYTHGESACVRACVRMCTCMCAPFLRLCVCVCSVGMRMDTRFCAFMLSMTVMQDPNARVAMFESADIIQYLEQTYAA